MFRDEADARAMIKQYCTSATRAETDFLISRLRPQFWIEPKISQAELRGGTRFGGAPDLPKDLAWPLRPPALHAKAQIDKMVQFRKSDSWLADHMLRELPYEFIAQINLSEAARFPQINEGLPQSGRLLFFWDGAIGPYGGGGGADCRVIWDDTPARDLTMAAIPPVFDELERAWSEAARADLPDTIKTMRDAGIDEATIAEISESIRVEMEKSPAKKPFVYPRRAMQLTPILRLPHTHSLEAVQDTELERLLEKSDIAECYRILTSRDEGPFIKQDSYRRLHRFLGSPDPEQDDPRYNAIDTTGYPEGPWSAATMRDAHPKAAQWRLLLQIEVGDLAMLGGQGTVYFIIHNNDLARGDFSRVHAYYQQT